jgi:glycosyltransferase involved in cell wall biosynthesis
VTSKSIHFYGRIRDIPYPSDSSRTLATSQPGLDMQRDHPQTIVHVITRLSLGGSAANTLDSAAAAARAGYRTIVAVGPVAGEVETTKNSDHRGYQLESIPSLVRNPSPFRDLRALFQIFQLIRCSRAEIVHTHTSKAGFLGRIAAVLAGVPVVIHTPHGHVFYGYYKRSVTKVILLLERCAASLTDYLVFLTAGEAREHHERAIGRPERSVTIPSGVDLETLRAGAPSRQAARRSLDWPDEACVVIGVGRLVPVKGFDLLVRAFSRVLDDEPKARLVLVGDGPERLSLERLAQATGISEGVTFVGTSEEVPRHLAASDILVAPSRNEGQGRVLVEAMALGLPVVGTRVGGIPDVLRDGECGLLVPPENPGELAQAILALARDGELRRSYGANALRQAERFSLRIMESQLLALYERAYAEWAMGKAAREGFWSQRVIRRWLSKRRSC